VGWRERVSGGGACKMDGLGEERSGGKRRLGSGEAMHVAAVRGCGDLNARADGKKRPAEGWRRRGVRADGRTRTRARGGGSGRAARPRRPRRPRTRRRAPRTSGPARRRRRASRVRRTLRGGRERRVRPRALLFFHGLARRRASGDAPGSAGRRTRTRGARGARRRRSPRARTWSERASGGVGAPRRAQSTSLEPRPEKSPAKEMDPPPAPRKSSSRRVGLPPAGSRKTTAFTAPALAALAATPPCREDARGRAPRRRAWMTCVSFVLARRPLSHPRRVARDPPSVEERAVPRSRAHRLRP
jgi:hypothetical protein